MVKMNQFPTRPALRQQALLEDWRERILSGEWAPGMRLPTVRELEVQFATSRVTVQTVQDRLRRDGFLIMRGRAGTFVCDFPPHHSRYALVFPFQPGSEQWSQFHTALYQEAQAFCDTEHRQFICFFGGVFSGAESYTALFEEVAAHRLAGVIFAQVGDTFANTPLLNDLNIPTIGIGGANPSEMIINLDFSSLTREALQYFVARERRNIAVIELQSSYAWVEGMMASQMAELGLTFRRRWVQSIGMVNAGWMLNCLEVLLYPGQDERPDGLLLLDDNLVPEASQALEILGIRVPDELEVMAHANFPWPTHSTQAFRRIGFDIRQLLHTCLAQLELRKQGVSIPILTDVTAIVAESSEMRV